MASRGQSPAEVVKKIDALIASEKATGEALQEMLFMKGAMLFRTDKVTAKKNLVSALAASPTSAKAKEIQSILDRFFKE